MPRLATLGVVALTVMSVLTAPAASARTPDRHYYAVPTSPEEATELSVALLRDLVPHGVSAHSVGRNDDFADSLAAATLGRTVLLTGPDTATRDAVAATINSHSRAEDSPVALLGGTAAVSEATHAALQEDVGRPVDRLAGDTRFHTAVAIAESRSWDRSPTSAVLVRATAPPDNPTAAFADTLGAGALAVDTGAAMLFTATDHLPEPTRTYLAEHPGVRNVTVIGGTAAISEAVVAEIAALGKDVTRVAGDTRYETADAINLHRGFGAEPLDDTVVVLDGDQPFSWASAFTTAVFAGNAPVVVTSDSLSADQQAFLGGATHLRQLICIAPTALCDEAYDAVEHIDGPGDRLYAGDSLGYGPHNTVGHLNSRDRTHYLAFAQQPDDAGIRPLQVHADGTRAPIWQSSAGTTHDHYWSLDVLGDGNVVMIDGPIGPTVWQTGTCGHPDAWLALTDDGELRVTDPDGTVVWSSVDDTPTRTDCPLPNVEEDPNPSREDSSDPLRLQLFGGEHPTVPTWFVGTTYRCSLDGTPTSSGTLTVASGPDRGIAIPVAVVVPGELCVFDLPEDPSFVPDAARAHWRPSTFGPESSTERIDPDGTFDVVIPDNVRATDSSIAWRIDGEWTGLPAASTGPAADIIRVAVADELTVVCDGTTVVEPTAVPWDTARGDHIVGTGAQCTVTNLAGHPIAVSTSNGTTTLLAQDQSTTVTVPADGTFPLVHHP